MGDSAQPLKSEALLEQMKTHLTTDTGKELTKKIGLVYQLHIAPKVKILDLFALYFLCGVYFVALILFLIWGFVYLAENWV